MKFVKIIIKMTKMIKTASLHETVRHLHEIPQQFYF